MDDIWWSVNWRWMVVWGVTVAALATALGILTVVGLRWRRRRIGRPRRSAYGISLYLNENSVMELYLSGKHKPALRQEVEEQITSTTSASLAAELYGFNAGGERGVNRSVFRKYVEKNEPTTVIRVVMDVLEKEDDILYIDLMDGEVAPNPSLGESLPFSQLRRLGKYVSIWGDFREIAKTENNLSFTASMPGGDEAPRAELTCQTLWMKEDDMPVGPFMAQCLGRIQSWDEKERRLLISPIAVFN